MASVLSSDTQDHQTMPDERDVINLADVALPEVNLETVAAQCRILFGDKATAQPIFIAGLPFHMESQLLSHVQNLQDVQQARFIESMNQVVQTRS